jgi:PKD repeat protein
MVKNSLIYDHGNIVRSVNEMNEEKRRFSHLFFILIIACLLLFSSLSTLVTASDPTLVRITPANQTVNASETFVVSVVCSPERPVKGYELKLSFNPSLVHATSVSEGGFFSGYTTFFNPGTINNQAGTIINIYDLIVGLGNVTNEGTLVTITFTARSSSGTSALTLYGVQLTNETEYISVSVQSGSVTVEGESAPPTPPPSGPPSEENSPPSAPLTPVGPSLVEVETVYQYNSSAVDPDGDQVRLRFDWGDGTRSNWSGFVTSATSVSMSHAWQNISTYTLRVIAQDSQGLNSSWSTPLTVMVSAPEPESQSPIVSFVLPLNITSDQSVVFDASGCVDPDGVIVSYVWDFGDGTQGTGQSPSHTYYVSGVYTVTLTVTDNSGLTSSMHQIVVVAAPAASPESQPTSGIPSYFPFLLLAVVVDVVLILVYVFRDALWMMLFGGRATPTSQTQSAESQEDAVSHQPTTVSSDDDVRYIEKILDRLFLDLKKKAAPLSKESLLEAYSEVIIQAAEVQNDVRFPRLSIAEVERLVNERYHADICEFIDKL